MTSFSREAQKQSLLRFASEAANPGSGGFGRLQSDGTVLESLGVETWINARMAYCFALEVLGGNEAARLNAELGCLALSDTLHDVVHDGWVEALGDVEIANSNKAGYAHAFVLLAASALNAASIDGSAALLRAAKHVIDKKFWSKTDGACKESFNADWSIEENYRGANSNMHMVEAFLACFDQTGEQVWLERALLITNRLLNVVARQNNWRLPEHFDSNWLPMMDYNINDKSHPFRPYGGTVGHWFEWARLAIELKWAIDQTAGEAPAWLREVAVSLYNQAIQDGWEVDGYPGFCYTVDWEGNPVITLRMSWVICEAISASHVLALELEKEHYEKWADTFWSYALKYFPDPEFGHWHSELDSQNKPSHIVWADKPDVYHLYQALEFSEQKKAVSLISASGRKK
jgi:mannose/cellobiose epimerase-like protein (N-acyl-D-glucosamine 2-epimerase family)